MRYLHKRSSVDPVLGPTTLRRAPRIFLSPDAACAAMLDGSKGMPDEASLASLPAQVDYLQRKTALLVASVPAAATMQAPVITLQPAATKVSFSAQ